MTMKRLFQIALVAGVVAAVVFVVIRARAQQAAGAAGARTEILDSAVVERGNLLVTITGTGTVTPARQVDLSFMAGGPVVEVLVTAGQAVRAGDVLARLDTADLSAAVEDAGIALEFQRVAYEALIAPPREVDIAAAQSAVNSANAALAAAGGTDAEAVEIARLQSELARNRLWQNQLERDRTMMVGPEFRGGATGAPSQEIQTASGLAQAELGISIADANYAAAASDGPDQAALGSARAQLAQAEVALERLLDGATDIERQQAAIRLEQAELGVEQARAALDNAALVAPFDGVIAANNLVIGELPPQTLPAMRLLDTSGFYVELLVDEADIARVELGQPVALRLEAIPDETLDGTVGRAAVTPTVQGQLVSYRVRVTVDELDPAVRAGMTATATVTVDDLRDVLIVPNRFIRIDRATQNAYVTVLNGDGAARELPVTLGLRNEVSSQIVSGLAEGQTVVLVPHGSFIPFGGG